MTSPYAYILDRKLDSWVYMVWGALIWILGLAPAARALTYQRTFGIDRQQSVISYSANDEGFANWVNLGVVGLVLGLGVTGVLLGLVLREARLPKAGLGLWLGAMALALGFLLSARFGLQPELSLKLFGLPAAFTAVYLLPPVPLIWFVRQVKKILLVYAYGSLLAALVAPQWAMEYSYDKGLIPGLDVRLHGLAPHANSLAPLLLIYLILSWFSPSKTRWERLHQAVVLLALLLAQSKTIWILLILAYLIRLVYATWRLPGLQRYAALALLGAILSGGTLYLITGPAWLESVEVLFSDEEFTTLTGRTEIWEVTLSLWERNPWFGYGPDLWDLQMGLAYAPVVGHVAPHAHSQFYQSLGQSGIIGVAGLFLYAITLLAYGTRYARVTNGVALLLVLVTLLRGITETPFRGNPGDSSFYIHFLIFAFLVLASRWKSTLDEGHRVIHNRAQPLPAPARDGPPLPLSKSAPRREADKSPEHR